MSTQMTETIFPAQTYLVWRKKIEIADIADPAMWQAGFGRVHEYAQKNKVTMAGPGSALYFTWDEGGGRIELGIGNAIEAVTEINDRELSLVSVAESKAVRVTVMGSYDQLREVHGSLQSHVKQHSLKPTLTIEEYTVTGMDKPNPKDWETNVYYLHE